MYYKKVNKSSRKQMIEFLKEHYRYNTMNSWNNSTSYANNVKVNNLGLTSEEEDILYDIIFNDNACDFYEYTVDPVINHFNKKYSGKYILDFNGRSGGYIVIYQCETKESDWKSYCRICNQKSYKKVPEEGMDITKIDTNLYTLNNKCGRCGMDTRENYYKPLVDTRVYPGRSLDMYEDFEEFTLEDLKERTKLVQDLDHTCDLLVDATKEYCKNILDGREEVI